MLHLERAYEHSVNFGLRLIVGLVLGAGFAFLLHKEGLGWYSVIMKWAWLKPIFTEKVFIESFLPILFGVGIALSFLKYFGPLYVMLGFSLVFATLAGATTLISFEQFVQLSICFSLPFLFIWLFMTAIGSAGKH